MRRALRGRGWLGYAVALVAALATLGGRLAAGFDTTDDPALLLFVTPILLAAYVGGLGPGLLATVLVTFATNVYLLAPRGDFSIAAGLETAEWIVLAALGALISVLAEALHRSRERVARGRRAHEATLAALGEGVIAADAAETVTYVNPEAARLTGIEVDEALGLPLRRLLPGLDPGGASERDDLGVTVTPVAGGGVVVLVRDRTDETRAERLRERLAVRDRLAEVAATAPGVFGSFGLLADGSLNLTYAGPGLEALLGVPAERLEAAGAELLGRIDPRDAPEVRGTLATAARQRAAWRHEFRIQHPSRGTRWIAANAVVTSAPESPDVSWSAFFEDVTERTDVRRRLERSEERFRTLVEAAPDIILAVGRDGTIEFAGPQVERLGYQPADLVGRPVEVLVPERLRSAHVRHRAAFAEAPQTRSMGSGMSLFALRRDGSEIPVEVSLGPSVGGSTTVIVVDVSARRDLEARLRQGEKLEAVGRLAGGVAHDFNNLLTVITGYGEIVQSEVGEGPARKDIDEVLRAAERASQLTGQLLAFSRQQVLAPVEVDLATVVNETLPMLTRLIGEDVQIVLLAGDDVPPIVADPGQIEQVIVNLAVNGRDAMPAGGTITIEVTQRALDDTHVAHQPGVAPGEYVCLMVSDTGSGIAPEVMEHVFEPFFTTKGIGHGTGLGLATVHGIVTQSGGHVQVHSERGLGTTFRLFFPPARGSAPPAREKASERADGRGRGTLLVCEDEPSVGVLMQRILEQAGYTVLLAGDPREALRLAASSARLDLLISDVVMPGMPGPELAERLEAIMPGLPTLFVSGYTADTVRERGRLPASSSFIEKPFAADDLLREVRMLLERAHAQP